MDWNKYFKEKDAFKRYAMLERDNRLSYDHVDNWLFSLKNFLSKPSLNSRTIQSVKDDRGCKLCDKKLTEHSYFYDNHKYIPKAD